MNKKSILKLSLQDVQLLRNICNRFGESFAIEKKRLLIDFSKMKIDNPKVLIVYHDCLLFLLAYPENQELQIISSNELERVKQISKHISENENQTKVLQLSSSGIAYSYITSSFSFDLVKWFCEKFPANISLYSCDADTSMQKEIIKLLLPQIEREAFEKKFSSIENWIDESTELSEKNSLQWFIGFFENADLSNSQRDYFYDALKLFVMIHADNQIPSRTTARIKSGELFFHTNDLIRKPNVLEIISQKITKPIQLSEIEKEELNTIAKCSLMMLHRENDPITYSNISGTELFEMGRGIRIAVYSIKVSRRVPVGSTIGYMIFKNSIPVSYGEVLIFGNFASVAFNVFEPFRGGESTLLYCEILRLLKQYYHVTVFEAEPYQIGKNNSEGIKSGAFWFYYRMGFKPNQKELSVLAEIENNKIQKDKSYRSDEKILRKLSNSLMILNVGNPLDKIVTTVEISEAISRKINQEMNGRQDWFLNKSFEHFMNSIQNNYNDETFSRITKQSQDLINLLYLIKNLGQWNQADLRKTIELFQLKSGNNELQFIHAIQEHKTLLNELYKVVQEK